MQRSPEVIATHILPFGDAEIVEWRWPSPLDVTVCEQRHMIEMSLPPLATSGTASFPDLGELRPTRIGSGAFAVALTESPLALPPAPVPAPVLMLSTALNV